MSTFNINPEYLIGLVVICVTGSLLVWWRKVRAARDSASLEAPPAGSATPPAAAHGPKLVHDLFHEANNRLRLAQKMKGASISGLPAFLLIGPQGAGKTNAILHSGLDPELLAGQAYQGTSVIGTKTLNIWLARRVVFIEISASLAADGNSLKAILKYLAPGRIQSAFHRDQPARGFLLCTDQATVGAAAAPDEITALARPWNECLSLAAGTLGIQLPVYVLFTKADALQGFTEFVSNLSAGESTQALGATIRPFNAAGRGAYAEETARLVNEHFARIAYALCDCRVPLLKREQNRVRLAMAYEFPREFQKLQKNLTQFLVEVARPSQLQVSPLLRGFYFCGTRKLALEGSGNQPVPVASASVRQDALGATTVLTAEQIRRQMAGAQASQPVQGPREITEWLFAAALFEGVLLRDRTAHVVSSASLRTDRVRAAAFCLAGALGIVLLAGLTTSYGCNRRLEKDLVSGAAALAEPASKASAARRLDRMRYPLQRLIDYRWRPPLSMRWGLYPGNDLVRPAQAIYCSAIREQVLPPIIGKITADLAATATANGDPSAAFDLLKAYMMMTTHPKNADETFLAEQLFATWKKTPAAANDADANQLLPGQFRLYGKLLAVPDAQAACLVPPKPGAIPAAQAYLRSLKLGDQYKSLLQQTGRGLEAVNYDQKYPNNAVHDSQIVPAWFTRQGWARMQDLLDRPELSLKADEWVLGESGNSAPEDLSGKVSEFRLRYAREYVQAWKEFLAAASVPRYPTFDEAVAKLEKMSGQRSYLLNLIALAAEHTKTIEPVKAAFQPAKAVAPAIDDFQPAAEYLTQLDILKRKASKAAQPGPAHDQDVQDVRTAVNSAEDSVDKIARSPDFRGDMDGTVKEILLKPIAAIKPLLIVPDPLPSAGKNLCGSYEQIAGAFPFSEKSPRRATFDQIQKVFDPHTGEMAQLYDQFLRDSLDCGGERCFLKAAPKYQLPPRFVSFFNGLHTWQRLLSTGGQFGTVRLSLRALAFNQLKSVELLVDDQHVSLPAGGDARNIAWDLRRSQSLRLNGVFEAGPALDLFSTDNPGPGALFEWIFNSEQGSGGTAGFWWVPRSGTTAKQRFGNGQTKEYKILIQWPDGPALERHSLGIGPCSLPATK